jgi:hypothetical protein
MRFLVMASAACAAVTLGFLGLVGVAGDYSLRVGASWLIVLGTAGLAVGSLELIFAGGACAIAGLLPGQLSRPTALAIGATALLSPLFWMLAAAAFSGRYARTLPARFAWIPGLAAGMISFAFVGLRWLLSRSTSFTAAGCPGSRRPHAWPHALLPLVLIILGLGFAVADRLLLVRRYAFVHDALTAAAFLCLQGAAGTLLLATGRRTRLWATPSLALVGLVGAWMATQLSAPEHSALRQALVAGGAFSGRVLDHSLRMPLATLGRPSPEQPSTAAVTVVPGTPSSSGAVHAQKDVVLVTIDALRADHLGLYGYPRRTSPVLDELARRAVVFDRAYAPTPHTSFSLVSLLTGRYVFPLVRAGRLDQPTLADAFRTAHYRTIAVFPPAVFFVERERFASFEHRRLGFEDVHYQSIEESRDATVRTDEAIRLLQMNRARPVFLWVHYFAPHEPYVPHPELNETVFGRRDVDRYDDEIRWVDRELGRLLAYIDRERPGALVVVTADHGEEFGDHDGAYHGTSLFDEQIRVPLLLALPGLAPRRVATAVSTIDLLPTLAGLTGLPWSAPLDGASLAGLISGTEAPTRTVFGELEGLKMAVTSRHKLLCDISRDVCRLFDLVADPFERRDLSSHQSQVKEPLLTQLRGWVRRPIPELLDPKSQPSAFFALIQRASRGEASALAALPDLLQTAGRREDLPVVHRRLAAQLLATRQPASKVDALELVARDDPDWMVRAWTTVAVVLGGHTQLAPQLADLEMPAEQQELLAYRALALMTVGSPLGPPQAAQALAVIEDSHLRCRLMKALAVSGDSLALPELSHAYPDVRTRLCVAQALAELRSAEATAFTLDRLKDEPYTTTRAALARALGRSGNAHAAAALQALFRDDTEQLVLTSAARALVDLGLGQPIARNRMLKVPTRARELWVVPRDQTRQTVHVQVDGRRQPQLAPFDRRTPPEAYAFALPEVRRYRSLRVFPTRGHALFR